jgi:pyridoxine kinase
LSGNRAATFPLQTLGYDVDVVNTVQFSNHTGGSKSLLQWPHRPTYSGYKVFKGQKTGVDVLDALLDGLRTNGIDDYTKILTGYVPGAEALEVVEKHVRSMMDVRPETVYILDRECTVIP